MKFITWRLEAMENCTFRHIVTLYSYSPKKAVALVRFVPPLEFNGLDAGESKRRPEVETLPVTSDNRTEAMKKASGWLRDAVN
jgi:hypothetical protein